MTTLSQVASGIQDEIRSANENFVTLFQKGDASGISLLYTPDGVLLPTGVGIQQGTDAIRNFWQAVMGMGIKAARLTTIEVEQQDDTAIEMGQYELSAADGTRMDLGKYIVIWKRVAGQWLLHKDIWNTSISNN